MQEEKKKTRQAERARRRQIRREVDEEIRKKNGGRLFSRSEVITSIIIPAVASTLTYALLRILLGAVLP